MPERDYFPKKYFESNPYEDETPEGTYKRIRWGNTPQETFSIDSPEPLATLGDVAKICTTEGNFEFHENEAPYLALGTISNYLYFVPKFNGKPINIPSGPYKYVATLMQTDYYSDKGGEDAYYYHEHEPPYPRLFCNRKSGVCILIPSTCEDGTRSYAVGDEGVIG